MIELLKQGEVVGVFAEGQRTWDGESKEPMPATAKLLRLLRTTVVVPHLRGAYLSLPRWSPFRRKGRLEIAFSPDRILPGDKLCTMSVYEIDHWLRGALEFSETSWQTERRIPFRARRSAEHIETLLYLCPNCNGVLSLKSRESAFWCQECGEKSSINRYGELVGPFPSVADWNRWQQQELRRRILLWLGTAEDTAFASLPSIRLFTGRGTRPLLKHGEVSISLKKRGLEITVERVTAPSPLLPLSRRWMVPYEEIHGLHVQLRQDLEFYRGKLLHVLRPISGRASTHFFERAIGELQKAIFTG